MKGIIAFRNSDSAFSRTSITLTEWGMAYSELRRIVNLQQGEELLIQLWPSRIRYDDEDLRALANSLTVTCNPFDIDAPKNLVNIASG